MGKSETLLAAQLLVYCTTYCKVLALYLKQKERNKQMPAYFLNVSWNCVLVNFWSPLSFVRVF